MSAPATRATEQPADPAPNNGAHHKPAAHAERVAQGDGRAQHHSSSMRRIASPAAYSTPKMPASSSRASRGATILGAMTVSRSLDFATGALPHAERHLMPAVWDWLRVTCGGKIERRRR